MKSWSDDLFRRSGGWNHKKTTGKWGALVGGFIAAIWLSPARKQG
jgi:hypothetical protein